MRGEVAGNGTSGDSLMRPKIALVFRVLYLRKQGANPYKNLDTFKRGGRWVNITPKDIIIMLKDAVHFLAPSLGFTPKYVSAQYLCAAGAMEILCYGVDNKIIKLVGLWRSDEML